MTPHKSVLFALAVGGLGCAASQPERRAEQVPAPNALPTPGTVGERPNGSADAAVVPASHAEPEPIETAATAQPLPAPRPAEKDAAPESGPPAPAPPAAAPPVSGSPPSVGGPLALTEVLASVERHYPLLQAAEQERAVAGGRLVSAMGAFDLNLTSSAEGQGTTYDNIRSGFGVSQGLPVGGLGVFAGYRTGYGEFPTYNLGQKTADGGEVRAGVSVPLLRDRTIDRPRSNVQQARKRVELARWWPVPSGSNCDSAAATCCASPYGSRRRSTRRSSRWGGAARLLPGARRLPSGARDRGQVIPARKERGGALDPRTEV